MTLGALTTWSYVNPFWNWEYGLFKLCLWFLAAILAKCYGFVPYNFICSIPALPNNLGANGGLPYTSINYWDLTKVLSRGFVLSGYFMLNEPLSEIKKIITHLFKS